MRNLTMIDAKPMPPADTGGTEITRFNALKHGVLSKYAVLPWEDPNEYHMLIAALAAEHTPQGPTEEHLVEELARTVRRMRRAMVHHWGASDNFADRDNRRRSG
jgi:hypothetical protein